KASTPTGTAQRKTVCKELENASISPVRTARGNCAIFAGLEWSSAPALAALKCLVAGSRRSQKARRLAKIVPKIATPNDPPIDRKKTEAAVATPISGRGT